MARILSDNAVSRWLTSVPSPYDTQAAQRFIVGLDAAKGPVWAIDRGAGLIGLISLTPGLGFWLAPAEQGRGLMTEAARAVVAWHFGRCAEDLVSGHMPGNLRSRRILLGLGFRNGRLDIVTQVSTGQAVAIRRMRLTTADWRGTALAGA